MATKTIQKPQKRTVIASNVRGVTMLKKPLAQVEAITPERAAEMLESGQAINNRKVAWSTVRRYAHDMANGKWKMTGESIKFDQHDRLIDGQHRLYAIMESGATIETMVVYGLTDDAFGGLDQQRRRNAGQFLGMHGYSNENLLAATVKFILRYEILGDFRTGRHLEAPLSFDDYLQFVQQHSEVIDAVKFGNKDKYRSLAGTGSLYAALYYLFSKVDEEDADAFFELLGSGAGLDEGDPILVLRNTLMKVRQQLRGSTAEPNYVAALFIKAWNAWRAGEKVGLLRYKPGGANPDKFPTIK